MRCNKEFPGIKTINAYVFEQWHIEKRKRFKFFFFFSGKPLSGRPFGRGVPSEYERHSGTVLFYRLHSHCGTWTFLLFHQTKDTTKKIKMKSFVFSFYMACFVVVSVMACDLAIEYEKDGVCCKMCGPGTRVNSQPSCEDPVCTPCGKYEYQPSYTKENKCKQQPYCDPNMNFQVVDLNPKKEASCNCKAEHHCSSLECLTCVPNTVCSPGEGVYQKATRFNDTVCRACGEGTFSNESSTVEDCRKWTTCAEKTHKIKKSGTPTSDVVCEEVSDNSSIAVGLSIGFVLAIVTGLLTCFIKKEPEMLKRCFKKGKNPGNMDDKIVGPLIAPEVGNHYVLERAWPGNGVEQQQESLSLQVPEETDESFPQNAKTFNNKPLRQEEGKMELTSQPESDGTAEHIESTFN